MKWKFKQQHSFDERKFESSNILSKYPDKIPLIIQKAPNSNIGDLDKHKFLIPYEVTIAQFIWVLRQRLQLGKNKAIYLFVNKTLPQSSALVGEVYNQHHDEDGFVYCMYSGENTFG